MDLIDISNKEEFSTIVISELKKFGVKYHKDKKKKNDKKKYFLKNIFCVHLHLLDLTEVILSNGKVVQIPKFVADACNRILEQVETEGIFRKAGSFVRQKEIRISLEAGVALGKSHHVIDVANVVKYFFRELPEPLIPPFIQETFLRSLLVGENYVKAILLSCLLLPSLTLNTLSFFMQFLYTVSLSENRNKMSIENLAIIFTPGLMPFPNVNSQRFTNHVKVVRILIENANAIGQIPRTIENKLRKFSKKDFSDSNCQGTVPCDFADRMKTESAKKKKKRRSDMFHGLKKIVGSAMGSMEFLNDTIDGNKSFSHAQKLDENIRNGSMEGELRKEAATPCFKANKKRKIADPVTAFSAKKKKDLLALLPNNSGGFLPNTPLPKESKKSRSSLGGERHSKNISLTSVVTSMERRWSIVGSGWSKHKNKPSSNLKYYEYNNCNFDAETAEYPEINDGKSNPLTDFQFKRECQFPESVCNVIDAPNISNDNGCCNKVCKAEYEDIKERVATIESHISNEFGAIRNSSLHNFPLSNDIDRVEHVQTQYERTVTETEGLSSPATEQLAQRLSRGLNIRRSIDQRVIRSPSARKIGTIRRRSQDKTRLSRNSSSHINTSNNALINKKFVPLLEDKTTQKQLKPKLFYDKRVHKSNHLNTSYSEEVNLLSATRRHNSKNSFDNIPNNTHLVEQWMAGEDFFKNTEPKKHICKPGENYFNQSHVEVVATPIKQKVTTDADKTPMLPPKTLPRKISNVRTPLNIVKKPSTTSKLPCRSRIAISTPVIEEISGRASIAQLRARNAGMVLAKAKLFDDLESSSHERRSISTEPNRNSGKIQHKINCIVFSKYDARTLENSLRKGEPLSSKENCVSLKETNILKSTPIGKRIQHSNSNSPASASKQRHRGNSLKSSQKQLIKSIASDDKLTKYCNHQEHSLVWGNGIKTNTKSDTSKKFNNFRNTKSPRRIKNKKNSSN